MSIEGLVEPLQNKPIVQKSFGGFDNGRYLCICKVKFGTGPYDFRFVRLAIFNEFYGYQHGGAYNVFIGVASFANIILESRAMNPLQLTKMYCKIDSSKQEASLFVWVNQGSEFGKFQIYEKQKYGNIEIVYPFTPLSELPSGSTELTVQN